MKTIFLLVASNIFMTLAWYGQLKLKIFEGKALWSRDLGEFDHLWGEGTSPVIHDGKVILNSGPGKKKVFVAAFKLGSGETIWEKEEPVKGDGDMNEKDNAAGVDAKSPAAEKRLAPGMVIAEVEQEAVNSPAEFESRITKLKAAGKKLVMLLVVSPDGDPSIVVLGIQ